MELINSQFGLECEGYSIYLQRKGQESPVGEKLDSLSNTKLE